MLDHLKIEIDGKVYESEEKYPIEKLTIINTQTGTGKTINIILPYIVARINYEERVSILKRFTLAMMMKRKDYIAFIALKINHIAHIFIHERKKWFRKYIHYVQLTTQLQLTNQQITIACETLVRSKWLVVPPCIRNFHNMQTLQTFQTLKVGRRPKLCLVHPSVRGIALEKELKSLQIGLKILRYDGRLIERSEYKGRIRKDVIDTSHRMCLQTVFEPYISELDVVLISAFFLTDNIGFAGSTRFTGVWRFSVDFGPFSDIVDFIAECKQSGHILARLFHFLYTPVADVESSRAFELYSECSELLLCLGLSYTSDYIVTYLPPLSATLANRMYDFLCQSSYLDFVFETDDIQWKNTTICVLIYLIHVKKGGNPNNCLLDPIFTLNQFTHLAFDEQTPPGVTSSFDELLMTCLNNISPGCRINLWGRQRMGINFINHKQMDLVDFFSTMMRYDSVQLSIAEATGKVVIPEITVAEATILPRAINWSADILRINNPKDSSPSSCMPTPTPDPNWIKNTLPLLPTQHTQVHGVFYLINRDKSTPSLFEAIDLFLKGFISRFFSRMKCPRFQFCISKTTNTFSSFTGNFESNVKLYIRYWEYLLTGGSGLYQPHEHNGNPYPKYPKTLYEFTKIKISKTLKWLIPFILANLKRKGFATYSKDIEHIVYNEFSISDKEVSSQLYDDLQAHWQRSSTLPFPPKSRLPKEEICLHLMFSALRETCIGHIRMKIKQQEMWIRMKLRLSKILLEVETQKRVKSDATESKDRVPELCCMCKQFRQTFHISTVSHREQLQILEMCNDIESLVSPAVTPEALKCVLEVNEIRGYLQGSQARGLHTPLYYVLRTPPQKNALNQLHDLSATSLTRNIEHQMQRLEKFNPAEAPIFVLRLPKLTTIVPHLSTKQDVDILSYFLDNLQGVDYTRRVSPIRDVFMNEDVLMTITTFLTRFTPKVVTIKDFSTGGELKHREENITKSIQRSANKKERTVFAWPRCLHRSVNFMQQYPFSTLLIDMTCSLDGTNLNATVHEIIQAKGRNSRMKLLNGEEIRRGLPEITICEHSLSCDQQNGNGEDYSCNLLPSMFYAAIHRNVRFNDTILRKCSGYVGGDEISYANSQCIVAKVNDQVVSEPHSHKKLSIVISEVLKIIDDANVGNHARSALSTLPPTLVGQYRIQCIQFNNSLCELAHSKHTYTERPHEYRKLLSSLLK